MKRIAGVGPGSTYRSRSILNRAEYGGVACIDDESNLFETKDCQIVPCPIHAVWAEWTDWGDCSEFCQPPQPTPFWHN